VTQNGKNAFGGNLHAYWDNILENKTKWFSEPTMSKSPLGLVMFEIHDSCSKGSNSIFGANFLTHATFECMDVGCECDRSICGEYGECKEEIFGAGAVNFTYHYCSCSDYYGGLFCQFSPKDFYVANQFEAYNMSLISGNGTDYEPDEYHDLFWNVSLPDVITNDDGEL